MAVESAGGNRTETETQGRHTAPFDRLLRRDRAGVLESVRIGPHFGSGTDEFVEYPHPGPAEGLTRRIAAARACATRSTAVANVWSCQLACVVLMLLAYKRRDRAAGPPAPPIVAGLFGFREGVSMIGREALRGIVLRSFRDRSASLGDCWRPHAGTALE